MQDVSKVVKVKSCEESQKIYCGQPYIMVTTGSRMFKRTCGKNRRRSCENPCVERKNVWVMAFNLENNKHGHLSHTRRNRTVT